MQGDVKWNLLRGWQAECYWLCTGRSAIDLNEPDFEALVHHEIKSKELEALVGQVFGADGRLNTCQTAPVKTDDKMLFQSSAADDMSWPLLTFTDTWKGTLRKPPAQVATCPTLPD